MSAAPILNVDGPVSGLAHDSPVEINDRIVPLNVGGAFDALPVGPPIGGNGRALTARQAHVPQFIADYRSGHGYPPTLREIGKNFGIRSTNGVNDHLRALERKGHIVRGDMLSRGIRIVEPLTGEIVQDMPRDALGFVKAENEALRILLRRVLASFGRGQSLTAEMVIVMGDVRAALAAGGKR